MRFLKLKRDIDEFYQLENLANKVRKEPADCANFLAELAVFMENGELRRLWEAKYQFQGYKSITDILLYDGYRNADDRIRAANDAFSLNADDATLELAQSMIESRVPSLLSEGEQNRLAKLRQHFIAEGVSLRSDEVETLEANINSIVTNNDDLNALLHWLNRAPQEKDVLILLCDPTGKTKFQADFDRYPNLTQVRFKWFGPAPCAPPFAPLGKIPEGVSFDGDFYFTAKRLPEDEIETLLLDKKKAHYYRHAPSGKKLFGGRTWLAAKEFSEGLAWVMDEGGWHIIDPYGVDVWRGKRFPDERYYPSGSYYNGYAVLDEEGANADYNFFIDIDGNELFPGRRFSGDGVYGFVVFFEFRQWLIDGYFLVQDHQGVTITKDDKDCRHYRLYLIDERGNEIFEGPELDKRLDLELEEYNKLGGTHLRRSQLGLLALQDQDGWFFVDVFGREVFPGKRYEDIMAKEVKKGNRAFRRGEFLGVQETYKNSRDEDSSGWCYIDRDGIKIRSPYFFWIYTPIFSQGGIAIVHGYDLSGVAVIDVQYCIDQNGKDLFNGTRIRGDIAEYAGKYALVHGLPEDDYQNKFFFIDRKGNMVFGRSFYYARGFSDGHAAIQNYSDWYYIDKTGKRIGTKSYKAVKDFSEGYGCVKTKFWGSWRYINKEGEALFGYYSEAEPFNRGLAAVKSDGIWHFINREGQNAFDGKTFVEIGSYQRHCGKDLFDEKRKEFCRYPMVKFRGFLPEGYVVLKDGKGWYCMNTHGTDLSDGKRFETKEKVEFYLDGKHRYYTDTIEEVYP